MSDETDASVLAMPDDVPNGVTHYDGLRTVYHRGNGVPIAVPLPLLRRELSISPDYPYEFDWMGWSLHFETVIPTGELVTITLKDDE